MKTATHKSILLIWASFLSISWLFAQESLSFRHIDRRQGLSQNTVSAIAQDGDGFMWLGTRNGLNRYDGYRMRVYEHGADSVGTLIHNEIWEIYVDQQLGKLWVCTAGGLCLYDPSKDRFQTIYLSNSSKPIVAHTVLRDQRGYLWAGTPRGLYRFHEASQRMLACQQPNRILENGESFEVQALYEDAQGVVWVGGTHGLFPMEPNESGEVQYKELATYVEGDSAMFFSSIQFIKKDQRGCFWLGTNKAGIFSWLPGTEPVHHRHDPSMPSSLSDDDVRAMGIDSLGRVWIGTFLGLNVYDPQTETFYRYAHEVGNPLSVGSGSVRAIAFDTRGSAWVGTYYGGLSYYNQESYRFTHHQPRAGTGGLSYAVVSSFWEDEHANLWVGTEGGGINYWDRKTNTYEHHVHTSGQLNGLSGNNIKTIIGQSDSVWIGTFATGLNLYRPSRQTWEHFRAGEQGLSSNNVYGLVQEGNTLWIATYGGGVNKMDLRSRETEVFLADPADSSSLISDETRVLMQDQLGQLWVGTNGGLDLMIPTTKGEVRFRHILKHKMIYALMTARDSTIWVGIYQQGVSVLSHEGKLISQYKRKDGLPGQTAMGILEDERGHIWISTENGLAKIDRTHESIISYNHSDGLNNLGFNYSAYFQATSGEMFFGGTDGFTSFFPNSIRVNTFVPPVVFTHLSSSNKQIRPGDKEDILQLSLNETSRLIFPYNQANLTLGFSALDFLDPGNNHYAYQLEGLDQDWKYIQGQPEVSYTLQRSGDYLFRLKGGNNDGLWNQTERKIRITVMPPPWRSPIAYVLYISLFLLLLAGGLRFIQMRHRLQLEKLTKVQQEELHQAKLRFYTNVTHEFRTPLTLILGPAEDLLRKGMGGGVERQLQAIQQNAHRLLRLVNQLLNFRSLEHDHDEMRVAEGNFVKFIRELYLSFHEQARIREIDYSFHTTDEVLQLWYDRDKLEKVFYNLLSNAFKFTPIGGIISVRVSQGEGGVLVEVSDSGPGIPESLRARIFDRYFHQSLHAQSSQSGTGIGLTLAKQLVDMHRGEIRPGDSPYGGANFRVQLPQGKEHYELKDLLSNFKNSENFQAYLDKAHEHPESTFPTFRLDTSTESRQTLLIVEDNEQVRDYIREIFEPYFDILQAENGKVGLQQARKHSPDLVISDIMMPEMDGINLCSRLKSKVETSHIPIILLTARTGQIFKVEGLETGADAYLTKPFSPYELQLKVHNLLETRQRIRERFHATIQVEPQEITVTSADVVFLHKAIEIVEKYMDDPDFSVEVFAREIAVSRPLLFTKLKAITSQTPNNFVKSLRLKRSAQLLTQSSLGVAEIAYQVGFRDARYFSKCFQKEFEQTPSEYRAAHEHQGG